MQFPLKPQDYRTILKGVQHLSGDPSRENITSNFPGTFVLVVQE